ncbi:MAG: hypothetical protein A2V77_15435 [Anaeromyxobacter sp. RBG_16_69_14]|nr:MAG: hypothetical protein A2V77_15435 [Anaeromyxobacter sp. RBG_16_69_14]
MKKGTTSSGFRMSTTFSGTRLVSTSSAGFDPNHLPARLALLKARTRNWRTWLTVPGASAPAFDCRSCSMSPGMTCSSLFDASGDSMM